MKSPAKERGPKFCYEQVQNTLDFCDIYHKAGGANKTNLSVAYAIILAINKTKGK